jgi:hypothetical protein
MAVTVADVETAPHDATRDNAQFLDQLRTIVGRRHVLIFAGAEQGAPQ